MGVSVPSLHRESTDSLIISSLWHVSGRKYGGQGGALAQLHYFVNFALMVRIERSLSLGEAEDDMIVL